jgi:hypothetical protein
MSFFTPEESDEEHLLIKLDSTSLLVKLLPEFDLIKGKLDNSCID